MPVAFTFRPAAHHAELGDAFFDRVEPDRFPETILRHRNEAWATRIGLDKLTEAEWSAHFGSLEPLPDSFSQPLALRCSGHKFRSYNPDLGGGRAFLFDQLQDLQDSHSRDLGTKSSDTAPWSRDCDGRLTRQGGAREVLATERLEALGHYTSTSFSWIETGEQMQRDHEPSPTCSAVLTRPNHSHIRWLLDYTVTIYMPEYQFANELSRAAAFRTEMSPRVAQVGAP